MAKQSPTPFFSVIIPTFNCENTILDTLESVSSQTFSDFELIVVDDGSTDSTVEILKNSEKIRFIQQENAGPGAARNAGFDISTGRYVAFLDSDDLWFPWTLQNYYSAITTFSARFISGKGIEFCGNDTPEVTDITATSCRHKDYLEAGAQGAWLGTCGVTIERSVFEKSGGFVGKNINAEDSDLWLKLGVVSPFVIVNSPPAFAYRRTPNSATGNLRKTTDGMAYLLRSEGNDAYPGGIRRRTHRDAILGTHIRPVCFSCLRHGEYLFGWRLYLQSLAINLRRRRVKFILGFPLAFIWHLVRSLLH